MQAIEVVKAYMNAWNAHDAKAHVDVFADDATYCDAITGKIGKQSMAPMAQELWLAFPDLSFDILNIVESPSGLIALQWLMKGTNSGSLSGLPPTYKVICVPGADFIQIENNQIRSVTGYFDKHAVPEQIGMQVVTQPTTAGPFSFGLSASVQSGKKIKPGAFSITQIIDRSAEERAETTNIAREILKEMAVLDGFIGVVMARIGDRGVTITAWENAENPAQLLKTEAHVQAMRRLRSGVGREVYTSVWIPERINPMWVNCIYCLKTNDNEKTEGQCACGAALEQPLPYW